MKLPNVLSLAIVAGITVALQVVAAGADELVPALWAPVLVAVVAAVLKAVQVYAQSRGNGDVVMAAPERKANGLLRQTLIG
jgi:hypothetical protein